MISEIHFSFIQDTRLADTLDDRSGIVVESDQNMDGYFIQRYIIHKCDIIIHDTRLADTLDGRSGIVAASWDRAAVPCIHVVVVVVDVLLIFIGPKSDHCLVDNQCLPL